MKNSKFLTALWLIFILTLLLVSRSFSQMDSSAGSQYANPAGKPAAEVAVK